MFHQLNKFAFLLPLIAYGQTPGKLTLQDAQALAIRNHPQIQAAQHEVNYANQQIVVNRSGYYPTISGDITGSQANNAARLGAGDISDSRIFDRFGQGVVVRQLITDSGRTPSLVASSRLQAQATAQTAQATRFDVLLQVNRAYFDVLRAEGVVKVAQQTVDARQLLADQVGELARNQIKSQLDVSLAEVNVSQAKLILLRARDAVQAARAELGRATGFDRPATDPLVDEPLPPGPVSSPDDLITQAMNNRPELAGLKFSRDAAYKFADAEKDLKRPTVSAIAVGGLLPYINSPGIPAEYEAVAANVSIPIFNGRLFSARHEAAQQKAMESDQQLRVEQQLISRDVRVAWAASNDAYQRIDVTAQFLRQAALALELANARYGLGLSSIVELTEAQLFQTQAAIENLNAKYDYQSQYAALQYTLGNLH